MFTPQTSTILIVDDDRAMRLLLKLAIEVEGYTVIEAKDGEECLAKFAQHQPQMVLLDAVMPGMDGFTCCQCLRQQARQQSAIVANSPDSPGWEITELVEVPVLMITVLDDSDSVDRAFEAGATDYVTKPIHWAVLCQRVRRLLNAYWATMQLQAQIERERALTLQLEAANSELKRLATIDGLTGIANRRHFDEVLDHEWRRAIRDGQPFSLLLCDVDYFKAYNDACGHVMGDHCLEKVATILAHSVRRPGDLVARYGGEEFVVIMPNTPILGAQQIAERIQDQLAQAAIPHPQSFVASVITLSIGLLSIVPERAWSATEALKRADQMLYRAKTGGRNRICSTVQLFTLAPDVN